MRKSGFGGQRREFGLEIGNVLFKLLVLLIDGGHLLRDGLVLSGQDLVLLLDGSQFFRKGRPAHRVRRNAGSELKGDAGTEHGVAVPESAGKADQRVFVRVIVRSEGPSIGPFVVAVAGGEVPLVGRIVFARMEPGQSRRAGTDFIDVIRQGLLNALDLVVKALCRGIDVADVGGARGVFCVRRNTRDGACCAVLTGNIDRRGRTILVDCEFVPVALDENIACRHIFDGFENRAARDEMPYPRR